VQWDPVSEFFKVIVGGAIIGAEKTLDAANDLYQQVMKSQRGRQGDVGDTGIRGETQELIRKAKAEGKDLTTKEALDQLMREAKLPNGKPDSKRKQRIKAEQKEQEARQSRESKDKPKPKKKK
jgi:Bacterial toxin 34